MRQPLSMFVVGGIKETIVDAFLGAHAPLEIAPVSQSVTKKFETVP